MSEPEGLFELDPAWRVAAVPGAAVGETLSAGRRLTLRIAAELAAGRHPLTHGPLHPEAAPVGDDQADGRRCGNCEFRTTRGHGDTAGAYPKCWYGWDGNPRHTPPRYSRGPATDCRAKWPACRDHQYKTPEGDL